VYQIQIRLYVVSKKLHYAGDYSRDYAEDHEILGRLAGSTPIDLYSAKTIHELMLSRGVLVCQELAQNLDHPLF